MRQPLRQKIITPLFSQIPISVLGKLTRTNLIVPYYHVISDDDISHVRQLYEYKRTKQFIYDLDFLLANYTPISLHDVLDFLKNGRTPPENSFLLTFDDGFKEMSDVVAPILLEKGIPATFFIVSDFVDNKVLGYEHKASLLAEVFQNIASTGLKEEIERLFLKYKLIANDIKTEILSIKYQEKDILDEIAFLLDVDFQDYLSRKKPYLSSEQIEELIKNGFTIGAHSLDHPLYSSLPLQKQIYQTIESVKFFKTRFCLDYGAFAFPYTDYNVSDDFFVELNKNGLIDVTFGAGGMMNDCYPNNLPRFSLEKPLIPGERIIAFQYARKLFKLLTGNRRIIKMHYAKI